MNAQPEEAATLTEEAEIEIRRVDLPAGLRRVDNCVLRAVKGIVCAVGIGFVVMVAVDVVLRFGFSRSIPQTNGVARFLLVWFFLLGAGLALRQGAHVGLDLFTTRLPRRYASILFGLTQILMLIFFVMMLWAGTLALIGSRSQVEGSLGVSMAWAVSAFPVGFILLIYHQFILAISASRTASQGAALS